MLYRNSVLFHVLELTRGIKDYEGPSYYTETLLLMLLSSLFCLLLEPGTKDDTVSLVFCLMFSDLHESTSLSLCCYALACGLNI